MESESMSFEFTVTQAKELQDVAKSLIQNCNKSFVFVFSGDLGAGKTTLIKEMCRILDFNDEVTSPTFSLVNVYHTQGQDIYHMDLYRLKSLEEAFDIGIEEYLYSNQYCFIEWPEIINEILTMPHYKVNIEVKEDQKRKIEVIFIPG